MHTCLSLDGAGRALDFPQSRIPFPLLGLEVGVQVGDQEENGRRGEVEILNDIISVPT